jgi:tetratricopeptide (TPR) repeat protein
LAWLQYALLQRGRYRDASAVIGELEPVVKASGLVPLLSDLASMRARLAIETQRWPLMATERTFANVDDLFAIGVSAARSRTMDSAEMARQGLAARAQSAREGDLRPAIAIMEREVAALIEHAAGRSDRAIEILHAAVQAELALPAPLGLPEPVKPAPELLGELLLETGRPREAVAAFEQGLQRNRNRSLSVLGLARAYAALGEGERARERYRDLLTSYDEADGDVAEVSEAKRALERPATPSTATTPRRPRLLVTLVTLFIVGACAALVIRRSRRIAPPRANTQKSGVKRKGGRPRRGR